MKAKYIENQSYFFRDMVEKVENGQLKIHIDKKYKFQDLKLNESQQEFLGKSIEEGFRLENILAELIEVVKSDFDDALKKHKSKIAHLERDLISKDMRIKSLNKELKRKDRDIEEIANELDSKLDLLNELN